MHVFLVDTIREDVLIMRNFADATSPVFQPFFLNFYKVHALATNFFLQMWNESGAAIGDFTRVVALVRSQCVIPKATRKISLMHAHT